jgi:hypothetical protein
LFYVNTQQKWNNNLLKKGFLEERVTPRLYNWKEQEPWKRRGVLLDGGHMARYVYEDYTSFYFNFYDCDEENYCLILYVIVFNLILFCMLLSLQHREALTLVSHMRKLWQFDVDVPMEGWFPTKMAVTDLADLAKTDH